MSTSKHPKGLYLIFATSTAERFSYYGMRAIFILFLTQALLFDKEHAASIYGSYTGLVYLTPLIGGSTLEAQKSIGQFVSQRLEDYWFKGSTMLSVNLPQITLSDIKSNFRIAHLHANLPGVLARVNRVLGEDGINIAAQALGTEGEIGYVVTDVAQRPDQRALDQLASIEGTIRMRVIS